MSSSLIIFFVQLSRAMNDNIPFCTVYIHVVREITIKNIINLDVGPFPFFVNDTHAEE